MKTIYFETYENNKQIESFSYKSNDEKELKELRWQLMVMARTKLEAHKNWTIKIFIK